MLKVMAYRGQMGIVRLFTTQRSMLYSYSQHDECGKRGAWVPTPYGNMSLMPWGVKEATASLFVVSHACPSVVHVMSVLVNISGKAG